MNGDVLYTEETEDTCSVTKVTENISKRYKTYLDRDNISIKYNDIIVDSIDILEDLGCTYEGKLKMLMTKMIGLNPTQGKNSVEIDGNYFKFEPILVFKKG